MSDHQKPHQSFCSISEDYRSCQANGSVAQCTVLDEPSTRAIKNQSFLKAIEPTGLSNYHL
jgi:hypothetical protein